MRTRNFNVDKLRVASPCPVAWDSMNGDERSRLCDQCDRHVYNIAGMPVSEVEALISQRSGRICVRLFQREDGTVLTQDCPVGLRMVRKRLGRFAVTAFGFLLGIVSVGYGQRSERPKKEESQAARIKEKGKSVLKGVVVDSNGAVIPGVRVKLFQEGVKKPKELRTHEDGSFEFAGLPAGKFLARAQKKGWQTSVLLNIVLNEQETRSLTVLMQPGSISVTVGMLEE